MREVVGARAMTVGKSTEEVKTKGVGQPNGQKGGVTGVAKGRRMLGLRPLVVGTRSKSTESSRAVGDVRDSLLGGRIGRGEERGGAWVLELLHCLSCENHESSTALAVATFLLCALVPITT